MKKNLLIVLAAPIAALVLISGTLYPDGSPGAKTGSPLDGATCTQCHGGNATEVSWISSTIPAEGWKTGETYTIKLTASPESANLIGFEVTAESGNNKVGAFIITDSGRTRFTNNNKALTHSNSGTTPTNGKNSWEMDWKAPDEDLGSVSFYAAFNAANGDATSSGDKIYASSVSYDQAVTTNIPGTDQLAVKVYPNPASNFLFIQSDDNLNMVSFYTLNGSLVKTFGDLQSTSTRLDISDLTKGVYIVKSQTAAGEFNRKIQLN